MPSSKEEVLEASELTFILIGTMVGVGVLSLPNALAKLVYQDAWVSAFLGALLPVYYAIIGILMAKIRPKNNIFETNSYCFGKYLGICANLVYFIFYIYNLTAVTSGFNNIFKVYATSFIPSYKFILLALLAIAYAAYKGLKTISRINQISFFITLVLFLFPLVALFKGSHYNVMPFFQSSPFTIIKSVKESMFSYNGMEILFIFYPHVNKRKKLKGSFFKAIGFTCFLYTYVCFLTLYYLGPDIVSKGSWSLIAVIESVRLPIINSFRFFFSFMWIILAFRTTTNMFYACFKSITSIIGEKHKELALVFVYTVSCILTIFLANETIRRSVLDVVTPTLVLSICILLLITLVILFFKR